MLDQIAEVVETASTEYTAQCLEPEDLNFPIMPAFGSWVKAIADLNDTVTYGVVYHASTMPIDSVHRAVALGLSLQELREQQPQIFAMLKTDIKVAILGFRTDRAVYQFLPPHPPQIHQAVYGCDRSEVIAFTENLEFLRTISQMGHAPVDQLLAAVLRQTYQIRSGDRPWLVQAGRKLSILLKDDYDRLGAVLGQIQLVV